MSSTTHRSGSRGRMTRRDNASMRQPAVWEETGPPSLSRPPRTLPFSSRRSARLWAQGQALGGGGGYVPVGAAHRTLDQPTRPHRWHAQRDVALLADAVTSRSARAGRFRLVNRPPGPRPRGHQPREHREMPDAAASPNARLLALALPVDVRRAGSRQRVHLDGIVGFNRASPLLEENPQVARQRPGPARRVKRRLDASITSSPGED